MTAAQITAPAPPVITIGDVMAVPCPGCAAPVGSPCITPRGNETTPHSKRNLAAAARNSKLAARYGAPVARRCPDCGGPLTPCYYPDGFFDYHCPGQCD